MVALFIHFILILRKEPPIYSTYIYIYCIYVYMYLYKLYTNTILYIHICLYVYICMYKLCVYIYNFVNHLLIKNLMFFKMKWQGWENRLYLCHKILWHQNPVMLGKQGYTKVGDGIAAQSSITYPVAYVLSS